MPPRTPRGPRRAGRRRRVYNVAGVISLTETGVLDTADDIAALAERARDDTTIKSVIPVLEEAERRTFATHGGGKWKDKRDGKPATLIASGKLYESLTNSHARGAIRRPLGRGTQLRFGSRLVQGVMQKQFGRDAALIDERGERDVTDVLRRQLLGE